MRFLDELKELNLPEKQYAIFGSGPMAVRGIRDVNDIDIVVKEDLWNNLRVQFPKSIYKTDSIKIGNIEIFKNWSPWFDNVNSLIDTAEKIGDFWYVHLSNVLKWKKLMGREKDKTDIKLIEDYLMVNNITFDSDNLAIKDSG